MSNVFFIGDLHFGHKNVHKFRKVFSSMEEHTETLIENWNSVIRKRDTVWVLGDAVFSKDYLKEIDRLNGIKNLVMGNHDIDAKYLTPHFNRVVGLFKYKGFWLSHAPIHPDELRGGKNIHGHVHFNSLPDVKNYRNVSAEAIGYTPIIMESIRGTFNE